MDRKRNKVQYYEVYENAEAKPDELDPVASISTKQKSANVRALDLVLQQSNTQKMQHDNLEASASIISTEEINIASFVSSCGTSSENAFDHAEVKTKSSYEDSMYMSTLLETSRKGPIVNNNPNFIDAKFHNPLYVLFSFIRLETKFSSICL